MNYDECLDDNPFFKEIQGNHQDVIQNAQDKSWIICVPRIGSIEPSTITYHDICEHILIPNTDIEDSNFCTLTNRNVNVQNRLIMTKDGDAIHILFDETFYVDKLNRFELWCIEKPLNRASPNQGYIFVRSVKDAIKLLWKTEASILDTINKIVDGFLIEECEFDGLDVLEEKVGIIYKNCTEAVSSQVDNVNLAVESYMEHTIHHKVFRAICNCSWEADAKFNKIHQNFKDVQLSDLEIKEGFVENLSSAKRELGKINRFSSVLGKIECLRRTVNELSKTITNVRLCVTADDLLKMFAFLVIKTNLNNWVANLTYVTRFRFSPLCRSSENSFLITNLEVAIEYIKSKAIKVSYSYDKTRFGNLLSSIRDGDLEYVKNRFKDAVIVDKSLCHPLCSCEKCKTHLSLTVNSRDDKGCTPLHVACMHGQPHIVEYLLSKNAEVDVCDNCDFTPLHYAALNGHQNALLLLLHANTQINVKNCDGNTPLHLAANNGHENCVKALLYYFEQKGVFIEVNLPNNLGNTALHFAVAWGYERIVDILLQYGGSLIIQNKRNQKVSDLIHNDHLKKLLQSNIKRMTIHVVVSMEKQKRVSKATELALKSIENNDLPLMCYYLGLPTVKSPPSTKDDFHLKRSHHPLCLCESCSKQFVTTSHNNLDSSKTSKVNLHNLDGFSPLHVAAKLGHTEILRLLLDFGALVNVKTFKNQLTPLHLACQYQQVEIVRELLKCGGCELDVQDSRGDTPLHYACANNNNRIVELLLGQGSDCNVKNVKGKTPLHEAKGRMLYEIVTVLRDKCDVNNCDAFENEYVTDYSHFDNILT